MTWLGPPQILFFHVLEFLFSPFYGEFLVFHKGPRLKGVFARIYTFPIDILWTEFVNKNMSSDTQKFLETARLSTLRATVEFHSALCQLWHFLRPLGRVASVGEEGWDVCEVMYSWSHTLAIWVHPGNVLPGRTFLSPKKIHSNKFRDFFFFCDSVFSGQACDSFHDSRNHSARDDWQTDYWGSDFLSAFPFHFAVIIRRINMQHLYSYRSTLPLSMCSCVQKPVDLIHGSKLIAQPPVGLLSWQEEAFPALECQPVQH